MTKAALRVRTDHPIDFTVADGAGIEKGSILKVTDPLTAAASDGRADKLAGIAAREKVASDGRTRLAVFRKGIFDLQLSGACSVGDSLEALGADDYVIGAPVTTSGSSIIGTALETGTDNEVIQVEVSIGAGGSQVS